MKRYAAFPAIVLFALMMLISAAVAAPAAQGGFTGSGKGQGGFAGAGKGQGGFTGPGPALTTVQQAREMRDDSHVALRGNIVQHLGKDKYLFRDGTGTVTVEIDHDKWAGQDVGPDDTVEIYGEVDKDWNSVEIDVDRLVKQ